MAVKSINDTEDDEVPKNGVYVDLPEDDEDDKKDQKKAAEKSDDKAADDGADDKAADDGGADDKDEASDDRLSIEAADERAQRRETRHDRRQRQKQARDRTQRQLREMQAALDAANARIDQLSRHSTQVDTYNIDNQLQMATQAKNRAEAALSAAIKAGNGDAAAAAMANRDAAVDHVRRMESAKERVRQQPRQEQRQQTQDGPDPRVARQFQNWLGRNDWFDPAVDGNGRLMDEDARLAMSIDQGLEEDGFDPSTKEYWNELEDRCREKMPHVFGKGTRSRDGVERTVERGGRRGGPPVNGGASGADKARGGRILVSTDRVQALKDAGVWDDPKLRNKYLKSYRNWDKDNADLMRGR